MVGIVGVGSWTIGGREATISDRMDGVIVLAELSTCIESSDECLELIEVSNITAGEVAAATEVCDTWGMSCFGFSGSDRAVGMGVLRSEAFCIDPMFGSCVGGTEKERIEEDVLGGSSGWVIMMGCVEIEVGFAPRRCEL